MANTRAHRRSQFELVQDAVAKLANGKSLTPSERRALEDRDARRCHVARDDNPKVCRHCGTHVDSERPEEVSA